MKLFSVVCIVGLMLGCSLVGGISPSAAEVLPPESLATLHITAWNFARSKELPDSDWVEVKGEVQNDSASFTIDHICFEWVLYDKQGNQILRRIDIWPGPKAEPVSIPPQQSGDFYFTDKITQPVLDIEDHNHATLKILWATGTR